ncbi:hypothetical protein G15_3478 [Enterococcus avium]|nr:hypothetical protein G15_3470 [Enterococcus avium]BBM19797.1 hypothetical protein G15_3478 [Enterococcus avium]
MKKIKIIRGFGIAFVAGLVLMLKLSSIQSLKVLVMIICIAAASVLIPTTMIYDEKEYEQRTKKSSLRLQANSEQKKNYFL